MPNILVNPDAARPTTILSSSVKFDYKYPDGLDLSPGSKLHRKLKDEIYNRALNSQASMSKRYPYWQSIDRTLTAYIEIDEKEQKVLEDDNRKPVSIVLPYSYAVMETLLAYMISAFVQEPIFNG